MGCLSGIGKILVLIRRIIAVVTLLVLVIALLSPFYRVKVDTTDYLYSALYTYDSIDGFAIWDYSTDTMATLIVLGLTWILTAFACLVLVLTAIRSNRGRYLSVTAFGLLLAATVVMFFIPVDFAYCTFPSSTVSADNGPCNSIWGSSGTTSWGIYYSWYFVIGGVCATIAMLVLGLISPNPNEEEEYTPITGSDYYS